MVVPQKRNVPPTPNVTLSGKSVFADVIFDLRCGHSEICL